MSRLRAAWTALTAREVIVVARGFQFSTYDDAHCEQTPTRILISVDRGTSRARYD